MVDGAPASTRTASLTNSIKFEILKQDLECGGQGLQQMID
jgi:hypothetical protein